MTGPDPRATVRAWPAGIYQVELDRRVLPVDDQHDRQSAGAFGQLGGIADAGGMAQLALDPHLEAGGIGRIDAKMTGVDQRASRVLNQELRRCHRLCFGRQLGVEVRDARNRPWW